MTRSQSNWLQNMRNCEYLLLNATKFSCVAMRPLSVPERFFLFLGYSSIYKTVPQNVFSNPQAENTLNMMEVIFLILEVVELTEPGIKTENPDALAHSRHRSLV